MYEAMKKLFILLICIAALPSFAQTISKRLQGAFQKFENDSQLSNAISSLYVINAKTGEVVFDKNSKIGLATASTLKVITAATAYELLRRDFKYETKVAYNGSIESGVLKGNLFLIGSGDPSFGSWRFSSTSRDYILSHVFQELKSRKIKRIEGSFYLDDSKFSFQPVPAGWIWEDIGNYYGAGTWAINWNENQYNLVLKPGKKIGDTTEIVRIDPESEDDAFTLYNQITTAEKGSGDNGFIYLSPYSIFGFTEGSIPLQQNNFTISGSMNYPSIFLARDLENSLNKNGIQLSKAVKVYGEKLMNNRKWPAYSNTLYNHQSPSLDSIIYWFLKKSINLYGEALVKTFAYQKNGFGETTKGVEIVKNFWKEKGIVPTELNIVDGSGLSPLNRVTTHAQAMVLKYAKAQPWFDGYYNAFPEYNGMKMKSGTINGVKGFCGYQKSTDGNEYIFSFLVNNYNGSASGVVQKMYKVLDELK